MIRLIVAADSAFRPPPPAVPASSARKASTSALVIPSTGRSPNAGIRRRSRSPRIVSRWLCRHPTEHSTNQVSANSRKLGMSRPTHAARSSIR